MWCSVSFGAAHEARKIANAARKKYRAILPKLCFPNLPTIKSEELLCSCGGCASDFFQRNTARLCNLFGHQPGVGGFASFPAKWDRREIRTIGFDHETVERNIGGDVANLFSIFESNDPRKRNQVAEPQDFVRLFERSAETMKYAANLPPVITQDFERIVPRVSLVNHDVHAQLDCKVQQLFEHLRL